MQIILDPQAFLQIVPRAATNSGYQATFFFLLRAAWVQGILLSHAILALGKDHNTSLLS